MLVELVPRDECSTYGLCLLQAYWVRWDQCLTCRCYGMWNTLCDCPLIYFMDLVEQKLSRVLPEQFAGYQD